MDRFLRRLQYSLSIAARLLQTQIAYWKQARSTRMIVICPNCSQKLRLPRRRNKLIVTCTVCRHEFSYQYYGLGLSSSSQKPLLVGLAGSLISFALVEILQASQVLAEASSLLTSALLTGVFAAFFGAIMGAAEGFFNKDKARLSYGFQLGFLLGLVSGMIAGLVYSSLLSITSTGLARVVGWTLLGLLLGGSYGIKENTRGDLIYGLIGGALGGAIGGVFFDPTGSQVSVASLLGRLMGFFILGIAISVAVSCFQEIGIRLGDQNMYQPLSPRLPANPRVRYRTGKR